MLFCIEESAHKANYFKRIVIKSTFHFKVTKVSQTNITATDAETIQASCTQTQFKGERKTYIKTK